MVYIEDRTDKYRELAKRGQLSGIVLPSFNPHYNSRPRPESSQLTYDSTTLTTDAEIITSDYYYPDKDE